jgi:hypothetical protein
MITNARTVSEVGYLLVDVLRFWHSAVDCASFGLLSEVPLLMNVLAPFLAAGLVAMVVGVEAATKTPEIGLPK